MATNDHTTKNIPTNNAEFADWAHAQIEEWRDTNPKGLRDALIAAVVALETAEQNTDALRADRDRLIREAHAEGARQADLAKITGISQQAIARIVKTVPAPVERASVTEARIKTISGAVFTGPTLRDVLDSEWGKLAKISCQFGRLVVTVPLDGGIAKLAEVQSYEVSDEDRLRAWERKHQVMGSELAGGEVQAARARFAEDGVLPEDAPNASELWLIQ